MLGGKVSSNLNPVVSHPCVGMIVSSAYREEADQAWAKAQELFSWWKEGKSSEWCRGISLVTEPYFSPTLGYISFAILTGGLPGPKASEEGQEFTARYKEAERELISYMESLNERGDPLTWYRVMPGPESPWYEGV